MQIVIEIPEKEFGIDIYDKFQDFFSRLKAEIKAHLIVNTNLVCGAYELETIDMFLKAFNDSVLLPKGHGRLIDADEATSCCLEHTGKRSLLIDLAPTVIEADVTDMNVGKMEEIEE